MSTTNTMKARFRGFLPVIVDVETGGFNAHTDALLEIAAVTLEMTEDGTLQPSESIHFHVDPFAGANLEPEALRFTGIDPHNPLRGAIHEEEAIHDTFALVRQKLKLNDCKRAILVGHNATFDLNFVRAAAERTDAKRDPFHPFSCFDTATLSGLALGHTVLAKACALAKIDFDGNEAHSAIYDAEKTAELFCYIVNRWKSLGGWPLN